MRLFTSVILVGVLELASLSSEALAQRRESISQPPSRMVQPVARVTTVRFQARTSQERLVSARRLAAAQVRTGQPDIRSAPVSITMAHFGETVTVTPRNPHVDNRVSLEAVHVSQLLPQDWGAGRYYYGATGGAGPYINTNLGGSFAELIVMMHEPKRLLVECTVEGASTFSLSLHGPLNTTWFGNSSVSNPGTISYLTPPVPTGEAHLFLRPLNVDDWSLLGCQVTYVSQ